MKINYLIVVLVILLLSACVQVDTNNTRPVSEGCNNKVVYTVGFKTVTGKPIVGVKCWGTRGGPQEKPWDR